MTLPTPSRARARAALVLVLLTAGVAGYAGTAAAHAVLVASNPANNDTVSAPPAEVTMTFDDTVVAAGDGAVRVLDPQGREVSVGAPVVEGDGRIVTQAVDGTAEGTWTVSYRLLSADGHVVRGSWVFHVGRVTSSGAVEEADNRAVDALGVVGRALAFAGSMLAVGGLVVANVVDRPGRSVGRTGGARGSGADPAPGSGAGADAPRGPHERLTPTASSAVVAPDAPDATAEAPVPTGAPVATPPRSLWISSAVVASVGSALAAWSLSADLAGAGVWGALGSLGDVARSFGWTTGPVARVVLAVLFVVLVLVPRRHRAVDVAAAVVSVALLITPAFAGHASAESFAAVVADLVHLLAAAAWIGGLGALVWTWVPDRARLLRYSRTALWSATAVVLSGLVGTWLLGGSWSAIVDSDWGRTLAVKLGLVAGVLFVGWVNRRWLSDVTQSVVQMVRSLRLEAVLAVAVLFVTAVLVDTPPPTGEAGGSVQIVRQAGDTTVRMEVLPAVGGSNEVHLYFLSLDGALTSVDAAELRVSNDRVEERRVQVVMLSPSHGVASDVALTPGEWTFEVAVVAGAAPATASFQVPIG